MADMADLKAVRVDSIMYVTSINSLESKVQDFENWLNRGCKSPKETALKAKLRDMLGKGKE